jgi:hypothetical protein
MVKSDEERRRARRFPMELPVKVTLHGTGGVTEAEARTRNVSSGGLYFNADWEVKVGSAIDFVLTLPKAITLSTDVRVQCVGRVVRVDPPAADQTRDRSAGKGIGVATVIEEYTFLSSDPEKPSP